MTKDELNELEISEIAKEDSYEHGYNMTRGGSGHRLLKIEPDDLIIMWESGISILEIANYFNCERQAIRNRLLGLGYTSGDLRKRRGRIAADHRIENHYNKELILFLTFIHHPYLYFSSAVLRLSRIRSRNSKGLVIST